MASGIAHLLATERLHASLPLTGTAPLYKTFQSLFLIECPTDDATTLQNIQLNAAFLEYLSTQGALRVKQLLQAWHAQKMKGDEKGDGGEMKEGVSEEKVIEEYMAMEILGNVQNYIRDGVNEVCVYFEGQEVEAIVMMEEVGRKVTGILNQGPGWFRPKFICQPREVV